MTNPLMLAVPSKGRLEENSAALFQSIGLPLQRGGTRGYAGKMAHIENVEIVYLPAAEIATRLRDGKLHFGVTGEDLLYESIAELENYIVPLAPLGFGKCDVVVAILDGWIDVTHMKDLAEVADDFRVKHKRRLRVATKYMRLTQDFFAKHDMLGNYQLIEGFGAIEGAPSSGAADLIVDITSSGATLKANQLRVLEDGVILQSQANLVASLTATWEDDTLQAAKRILTMLEAYMNADKKCIVRFAPENYGMEKYKEFSPILEKFDVKLHSSTDDVYMGEVYQVPSDNLQAFVEFMQNQKYKKNIKYTTAIVSKPDYIFAEQSKMFARLVAKLEKAGK